MAIKPIIVCLWKHHVNLLLRSFRSVRDEDPGLRIESVIFGSFEEEM